MSLNKVFTVPDYDLPTYTVTPKKKKKVDTQDPFAWSHEDSKLKARASEITKTINKLSQERKDIIQALKKREQLRNQNKLREVQLYAIKLEDGCWYIGMSYNPQKRFLKHSAGKGAQWTKVHPPIELVEVRKTGKYIQDEASKLEDDMTLEYALKYGRHYVRGGGYCQAKPKWPDVIIQNEPYF